VAALRQAGLAPFVPEGSYFIMADSSRYPFDSDFEFCRFLTREVGVAAIPPSAFYGEAHRSSARHLVRFAFCKTEPVLEEAARRLARLPSVAGERGRSAQPGKGTS